MGVESGPHARALATALAALRVAASKAPTKPTLARIVKHCADNGVTVSKSTVSGWLTGQAVPDSPQEFGLVVGFLNGCAERGDPGYERLDLLHWERLRRPAREERRGTQGVRTRKGNQAQSDPRARLLASLHAIQVRESIAPIDRLQDRERELEMLTEFCHGDDQPYLWIQGEPWAGKSAVLSTFALDPPPNLTVVSFFVTDRLAARNDHTAFTAAVLDQLAVLMPDQKPRIQAEVLNRDGLRSELLAIAAHQEAEKQRRLVLVVDGLDEDSGKPSIASLLPAVPDENLRIVVASRHVRVPVPHGHLLAAARRYPLTASEFAAGIRDRAVAELDALLDGPERERELLALITVANGLSVAELESLTGTAPFEIDRLLGGRAGRSFRASTISADTDGGSDRVYALAHETLQRTAETRLGTRLLTASLDRLHTWAAQYRDQGWPNSTPIFLLHRYFAVLERHHDLPRMAALALAPARHELLYTRTGGERAALTEIGVAQQCICDQPKPDLLTTARLARRRDHLRDRNQQIPTSLVVARARLGQTDRAEAIARSNLSARGDLDPLMPRRLEDVAEVIAPMDPDRAEAIALDFADLGRRANALVRVAEVIVSIDPDRAARFADRAEAIARDITDPEPQARVLVRVAGVIASKDPGRAEAIARDITDLGQQADVLVRVAVVIASIDPDRAGRLADRAETIARDITDLGQQADVLARVAVVIALIDPDRASRLADRAEAIAREITDLGQQARVLVRVAEAIASIDPDRAEAIARDIPDQWLRAYELGRVAEVIASIDPDRAEAIAREITDLGQQADVLVRVAAVIVSIDPDRAGRLADRAEAIARDITDPHIRVRELAQLAEVIASIDPDHAGRLADRAEAIARDITDPHIRVRELAQLAEVIASIDPDRAEAIAREITDLGQQADVLARVAAVIASIDPDRASRLADNAETTVRGIPRPWRRAYELGRVAAAIASIDPDRAEAIAREITDLGQQADVLARVAAVIASIDPDRAGRLADRAEAIARDITDPHIRVRDLAQVAEVIASIDPDRAEAIARDITDLGQQADVLARAATVIASIDPDRAEAIAREITDLGRQADVLARVAAVIASIDPDRASRLADNAETTARAERSRWWRADALGRVAAAIASIDPDRAARLADNAQAIAREMVNTQRRVHALDRVAEVIASIDPDRAEAIARDIADPGRRAHVLVRRAEAIASIDPDRAKSLLALAWKVSAWAIPLAALPVVDPSTLNNLASDLINGGGLRPNRLG